VTIDTTTGYYKADGKTPNYSRYYFDSETVLWNTETNDGNVYNKYPHDYRQWFKYHPLVALAHELGHALDDLDGSPIPWNYDEVAVEMPAVAWENFFRYMFYKKVPGYQEGAWEMLPKPQTGILADQGKGDWLESISWDQFFHGGPNGGAWVVQP